MTRPAWNEINHEPVRSSRITSAPFEIRRNPRSHPFSQVALRAQMALVLTSEEFVRCLRMQRFLEFVIEETLAGRAKHLCEYAIGVAVFDQPDSFDPASNPIVRNDARRLRQKLHEYYRHSRPGADQFLIDIPKGGYVPVFHLIAPRTLIKAEVQNSVRLCITGFGNGEQLWTREYDCAACETLQIHVRVS